MSTKLRLSPSLKPLLRQLLQDAMIAIQECRNQYATEDQTHNGRIYDTIGFLAAFTARLRSTPSDMHKFLGDEYWLGKPHEPKAKNVVRLATMYVLGAKESRGALYQQALTYSKVVDHFLTIGADPTEIPGVLRRKTIYGLLDELNPPRDHEGSAGADEPVERQAQPKGSKLDDVVRGSSREDEVYIPDDDEQWNDANDDEAEAPDPSPAIDEDAAAGNTMSDEEGDDLLDGIPDPKQERREWEKALIMRARAAWSEGYEVLLIPTPKRTSDDLVQLRGRGNVRLTCEYEYEPVEDWLALLCFQIKVL